MWDQGRELTNVEDFDWAAPWLPTSGAESQRAIRTAGTRRVRKRDDVGG